MACAVIYLGFDDLPLGFLFGIALYFLSIVFCVWSVFRYKPIYDRWVMQHGTDPEKWPGPPKPK